MDFEQFGRMFRKAHSGLRQKELVDIVRGLPENSTIHKILDVGCATGLTDRAEVITGDFLKDDIGSGYDLIIGISIMLFAKGNMEMLLKKFYDALNPGGVVLLISEGIDLENPSPQDIVVLRKQKYCLDVMRRGFFIVSL